MFAHLLLFMATIPLVNLLGHDGKLVGVRTQFSIILNHFRVPPIQRISIHLYIDLCPNAQRMETVLPRGKYNTFIYLILTVFFAFRLKMGEYLKKL